MKSLPEPDCPLGYTRDQLVTIFGERLDEFGHWMRGSTMSICEGRVWNYDTHEYEKSCSTPHGMVTYASDVHRFLSGLPQDD